MVVMVVRDHDEIELLHAEESQGIRGDALGFAGIDEDVAAVWATQENGIALPDIEEIHQEPVGVRCGAGERDGEGLRRERLEGQQECCGGAEEGYTGERHFREASLRS
jgi:hypothetical protein